MKKKYLLNYLFYGSIVATSAGAFSGWYLASAYEYSPILFSLIGGLLSFIFGVILIKKEVELHFNALKESGYGDLEEHYKTEHRRQIILKTQFILALNTCKDSLRSIDCKIDNVDFLNGNISARKKQSIEKNFHVSDVIIHLDRINDSNTFDNNTYVEIVSKSAYSYNPFVCVTNLKIVDEIIEYLKKHSKWAEYRENAHNEKC